ncbi:hypothetical protein [Rhodoferax sp. GW822-FHT02A01]|uniref:hypothetical protein n=1 Tax=Rhodoferax sp. GW822-FHT02A01 TaxID=3141537 RepID=UPI00315C76DF
MHLKVTEAAKAALRSMAEQGSSYSPGPNAASELVALGFAESNGQGGVRITADGRKFLRDIDAGVQF